MRNTLFLLFCTLAFHSFSQDLPRKVYLGIRMENLTLDARDMMGLEEGHGVLIAEVLPHSTAEQAGFKKGDILLAINDQKPHNTNEVLSILAGQKPESTFTWEIFRDRKKRSGKAKFTSFPNEQYKGLSVGYESAKTINGQQRYIITKTPGTGKLPVVLFIGGIGCYSLDSPFDSTRSEVQFLNGLARKGYLGIRLEKPGVGDATNYSTACSEVSFNNEVRGYVEMIQHIRQRPDVDPTAIYIFGHSMGGVMAPLIARETPIAGIIAYGTIGSNFPEYLAKTRRTIGEAMELTPEETDDLIKGFLECAHYYFVEGKTTEEAAEINEDCAEYMAVFDYRSRAYNTELYNLNIPANWKDFEGQALLLWGEADYVAAREDHEIIASTIEHYRPGHARFVEVTDVDHGMHVAGDFQEAVQNPGPYNPSVGKIVFEWLEKQR